ncbi:MAG: porin family protein [Proteobacteria bacterium]|nr:porin family protein [Pseudomonadota bacterium]
MKRIVLAGVGLAVLSVTANAADLGSRRRQPVVAPVAMAPAFTWTGIYAGVNAGYAWNSGNDWRTRGDAASLAYAGAGNFPYSTSFSRGGFVGGGQLGANYQIGRFVVGAETDIMGLGSSKKSNFWLASGTYGTFKDSSSWLGTTRVRLGFTPVDNLLIYGTGGAAYGNVKHSAFVVSPGAGGTWAGSKSDTKFGWALGAGAEYAFTNNITGRLEYLYYDLGRTNVALGTAAGASPVMRAENRGNLVRAGLNYKF